MKNEWTATVVAARKGLRLHYLARDPSQAGAPDSAQQKVIGERLLRFGVCLVALHWMAAYTVSIDFFARSDVAGIRGPLNSI